MNRVLIGCAGLMVVVLLVVLGIGTFASKAWSVERSVLVQAPPERVHAWVADLSRWPEWSSWANNANTSGEWAFEGDPGEGMSMRWTTERGQDCALTITASDPRAGIEYDLAITDFRSTAGGVVALEGEGPATVTWRMEGEMSGLLGGLFARLMEPSFGPTVVEDLDKLRRLVEEEWRARSAAEGGG